jgi:hypothetical protein
MSGKLRLPTSHSAGRCSYHGPASGPAKFQGMVPLCVAERETPVVLLSAATSVPPVLSAFAPNLAT